MFDKLGKVVLRYIHQEVEKEFFNKLILFRKCFDHRETNRKGGSEMSKIYNNFAKATKRYADTSLCLHQLPCDGLQRNWWSGNQQFNINTNIIK